MHQPNDETHDRRLRIGSLFAGYGGLDLAVEEVFGGETVWFSEFSPVVARVFAHHWPGVPNLGDITTIDWHEVEPVDVICGGFPCQDVSTVGRMAGLHPGTRSGLWARMAEAIDMLQPEWVVAENVRGLLSAAATRPTRKETAPMDATPSRQPRSTALPFAVWNPTRGIWEISQLDLYGHLAPYSVIWPTSGTTPTGSAYPLPTSENPTPAFASSSSPAAAVSDPAGLRRRPRRGEPGPGSRPARHNRSVPPGHRPDCERANGSTAASGPGTAVPLIEQLIDAGTLHPGNPMMGTPHRRRSTLARSPERWRSVPASAPFRGMAQGPARQMGYRPRPHPTPPQQLTALGNGVVPAHTVHALRTLLAIA